MRTYLVGLHPQLSDVGDLQRDSCIWIAGSKVHPSKQDRDHGKSNGPYGEDVSDVSIPAPATGPILVGRQQGLRPPAPLL